MPWLLLIPGAFVIFIAILALRAITFTPDRDSREKAAGGAVDP